MFDMHVLAPIKELMLHCEYSRKAASLCVWVIRFTLRKWFCLPQILAISHNICVCSSHFQFSLCFWISGIVVTFSKCQILALRHCACCPHLSALQNTQTNTHGAETHTPRLEPGPCVFIYLGDTGAWHRVETPVDSVLRLPMLLFWSAASWWQIYIKLIVFSRSLRFCSPVPWHWGKMLQYIREHWWESTSCGFSAASLRSHQKAEKYRVLSGFLAYRKIPCGCTSRRSQQSTIVLQQSMKRTSKCWRKNPLSNSLTLLYYLVI